MQKKEAFRAKLAGYARIGICAALTVLFAVLCVLELIPAESSGLATKEKFEVSSASLTPAGSPEKHYTCLLMGVLKNPTDKEIRVDALRVSVEGEDRERILELPGFVLPARTSRDVSYTFEDTVCYDDVKSILVTSGAAEERIPNRKETAVAISGSLIFSLIGLAVSVLLLIDSCKRFGYLRQELAARSQIL